MLSSASDDAIAVQVEYVETRTLRPPLMVHLVCVTELRFVTRKVSVKQLMGGANWTTLIIVVGLTCVCLCWYRVAFMHEVDNFDDKV